jgi:hypothetical protein
MNRTLALEPCVKYWNETQPNLGFFITSLVIRSDQHFFDQIFQTLLFKTRKSRTKMHPITRSARAAQEGPQDVPANHQRISEDEM